MLPGWKGADRRDSLLPQVARPLLGPAAAAILVGPPGLGSVAQRDLARVRVFGRGRPSLRARAPARAGATRIMQQCRLPQPRWVDGRCVPA
eukprot:1809314-Alexandrium_andersonii.AAC.1